MNRDWLKELEEQDVQFAVLDLGQDARLIRALRRQPGWSIQSEGDGVVILACSPESRRKQWSDS
jgi:hypothetical protein